MSKLASLGAGLFATGATGYLAHSWGLVPSNYYIPNVGADSAFAFGRVPNREQQIEKLKTGTASDPFDVLVIGGGATGSGCAVDAATRGLRTALVEREDFGSGTSSRSTKLVHGGVRYLEKAVFNADPSQLKLVREALSERAKLLKNAPHLSSALPILTPCYTWWEVPYYWAGLKAYDLVAGTGNLVLSHFVPAGEVRRQFPMIADKSFDGTSLKGAIMYYDGQFDDARLNITLICSAAAAGAVTLNYTECKALIKNEDGKVIGATVRDTTNDVATDVYAKVIINATGPFTDQIRHQSDPNQQPIIAASSGVHISLPAYLGGPDSGLVIPKTKDGRVVFMLPWLGHMIAGTTDVACDVTTRPKPTEDEITFILATLSDYMNVKLDRSDVLSAWSGLRPLPISPKAKNTQSIVRDHVISTDPDGLLNVSGGKWTTYRRMAEETMEVALKTGRLPADTRPCATAELPLLGATEYKRTLAAEMARTQHSVELAAGGPKGVVPPSALAHLASAYGDRAPLVVALGNAMNLGKILTPGHPVLEAEVVYCCRYEYCQTVSDFISRRSRLAFLDTAAATAALPRVAQLMAAEHGWSDKERENEIDLAKAFLDTFCHAPPPL